ncbi:MAG: PilZ domain-containing protein [Spirochaetota bacterium]
MNVDNMISYNDLSDKIRAEVELYHEQKVKNGFARDLHSSIREWFDTRFEAWYRQNNPGNNGYNKRNNIRIDVKLPVTVADTLVETLHASENDFDLAGTVLNISRGGLYFVSKIPYQISTILRIKINFGALDSRYSDVDALTMVTRCEKLSDGTFGIGVAFSSIYDDERDTLDMFIFKQLTMFINNSTETDQS